MYILATTKFINGTEFRRTYVHKWYANIGAVNILGMYNTQLRDLL